MQPSYQVQPPVQKYAYVSLEISALIIIKPRSTLPEEGHSIGAAATALLTYAAARYDATGYTISLRKGKLRTSLSQKAVRQVSECVSGPLMDSVRLASH